MTHDDRSPDAGATPPVPVKWPPPGLERTQGDLLVIAVRGALAGASLVLPMLFVAAREYDFTTLGPFADAWWVTIVLTSVGLAFGLDTIVRVVRSMRRSADALDRGYDVVTVVRVLADGSRDMGFLLTGARHFSLLERRERYQIARMRVAAAAFFAGAGVWLLMALSVGLWLAARGLLSPRELQGMILLPSALGYVVGGVATLAQEAKVRRARKLWFERPSAEDQSAEEIRAWQSSALHATGGRDAEWRHDTARALARGAVVVGAFAILLALPVFTLVPSSAIAPILTTISTPTYDIYRTRAARVEAYRSYVVEGDVSITPGEAGRILHDLMFVGSTEDPSPGERPPSRRVERPWFPEGLGGENPTGLLPHVWADSLIQQARQGVDPAVSTYLRALADHPSTADFARLSRATALDAAVARWETPFPTGMRMATVPVPGFRPLRDAGRIHLAAAALAVVEGRLGDAERRIREVISVGFLLGDEGPTLLDNIVGYSLIEDGGKALIHLLRATGRAGDAAILSRLNQVAERAAGLVTPDRSGGVEAFVRSLPGVVMDTTLMRGLRWEYFSTLATMAPCVNMHRIVFGADENYTAFIEEARGSLIRWPSEEPVFELARRGWVGGVEPAEPTVLGWVTGLYMSSEENSCAQFVRHMRTDGLF